MCVCVCVCVCVETHSLRRYLDELLEQLHSLAERAAQTHLRHHPELQLVEAPQEQGQVGGAPPVCLPPERVVHQLLLHEEREERRGRERKMYENDSDLE